MSIKSMTRNVINFFLSDYAWSKWDNSDKKSSNVQTNIKNIMPTPKHKSNSKDDIQTLNSDVFNDIEFNETSHGVGLSLFIACLLLVCIPAIYEFHRIFLYFGIPEVPKIPLWSIIVIIIAGNIVWFNMLLHEVLKSTSIAKEFYNLKNVSSDDFVHPNIVTWGIIGVINLILIIGSFVIGLNTSLVGYIAVLLTDIVTVTIIAIAFSLENSHWMKQLSNK